MTSDAKVVWEEPPEATGGRPGIVAAHVEAILAELRARPGEWARVYEGGGGGYQPRKRLLENAGCECRGSHHDQPYGHRALYARWRGES